MQPLDDDHDRKFIVAHGDGPGQLADRDIVASFEMCKASVERLVECQGYFVPDRSYFLLFE